MDSSKSQASRASHHTFMSGATLYDHEEEEDEETYSPRKTSMYLQKQREALAAQDINPLRRRLPRNIPSRKPSSPLRHSITDEERTWKVYERTPKNQTNRYILPGFESNTQQESPKEPKGGRQPPQKPKSSGYVAFVEDYDESADSSDDETQSEPSLGSLHPSDAASAQLPLPTMTKSTPPAPPPPPSTIEPSRHPAITRPSHKIHMQIDPRSLQDITVHSEHNATDDLEEDLEQFARLVRLGRLKAARGHFDRRLSHFMDNPYVLDHYCAGLLAMWDFHALSQIDQKLISELRPGVLRANIDMRLDLAGKMCGNILTQKKHLERLNVFDVMQTIWKHWPRLDSTELDLVMLCIGSDPNTCGPIALAEVYLHLKGEGRIWDFRDLLKSLLYVHRTCVCQTLGSLLADSCDGTDERLARMIERIEDDWGTATPDEQSSFALLDIFTTLTLASMSTHTSTDMVKSIFEVSQTHALEVAGMQSTNTKSRPYLCWIIAKVLLEQYVDPNITGYFALASHLDKLPGGHYDPEITLPTSYMIIYAPVDEEAPKWQPDPTTTLGHDGALRTVLGVAEELGDAPLQVICLELLIYQSPQPKHLLDKLGDLWHSLGSPGGFLETRIYSYIPASLTTPTSRETIRREILLAGEIFTEGPVSHARAMVLRALSRNQQEKDSYESKAATTLYRFDQLRFAPPAPGTERPGMSQVQPNFVAAPRYADQNPFDPLHRTRYYTEAEPFEETPYSLSAAEYMMSRRNPSYETRQTMRPQEGTVKSNKLSQETSYLPSSIASLPGKEPSPGSQPSKQPQPVPDPLPSIFNRSIEEKEKLVAELMENISSLMSEDAGKKAGSSGDKQSNVSESKTTSLKPGNELAREQRQRLSERFSSLRIGDGGKEGKRKQVETRPKTQPDGSASAAT